MNDVPETDAIWRRLSGDLRQFFRRRVADEHVADDLVQETFVRVHRNLAELEQADRVAAWVYAIARNVVRDHYRRSGDARLHLSEVEPADEAADGPGERTPAQRCAEARWLAEMAASLPEGYREAIELAEIAGLPQQEVADRLGLSLSAAKSRIQRGRAMLRDAMNACCAWEFDRRGNVVDYEPRPERTVCRDCDE